MNLFNRTFQRAVTYLVGDEKIIEESYANYPMYDFANDTAVWDYTPEYANRIAAVYTCVGVRADFMSQLPILLKNGITTVNSDLAYILNKEFNDWTNRQTAISTLESYRSTTGNSYAIIHRERITSDNPYGYGNVKSIEIIHPKEVVGAGIIDGELFYRLRREEVEEIVSNRNILHFREKVKRIDQGVHWGINPLEALRQQTIMSDYALNSVKEFYKNDMSASAYVKSLGGADAKKMEDAIVKHWERWHKSKGKWVPLIPNTELQTVSISLRDSQFIDMWRLNDDKIASVFGLPPHWVGNAQSATYANVEFKTKDFVNTVVDPIANMYEAELNTKLLTREQKMSGWKIVLDRKPLIENDYATKMNGLARMANSGALLIDEFRQEFGLPPLPEGLGQRTFVPGGYKTLGKLIEEEKTNAIKNESN